MMVASTHEKFVNVLLVEDDDVDTECVERAFKKAAIKNPIVRAKDGIHALDILYGRDAQQHVTTPCMFLVDINMPRMNGIELIQTIRKDEQFSRSIIFVLTTSRDSQDKKAAYDLNVAGYLVKSHLDDNFNDMVAMLDAYWRVVEFPDN